ncbi:MAG: protein phosphatase 2C domain-containing protein [Trueperella sp.]|nr:protein phosphatase 2C domain-containing protein [Trueperella sp.]
MFYVADHAIHTDIGLRRKHNEDSTYRGQYIYAVADGMGGAKLGDRAAQEVVHALDWADGELARLLPHSQLEPAVQTENFQQLISEVIAVAAQNITQIMAGTISPETQTQVLPQMNSAYLAQAAGLGQGEAAPSSEISRPEAANSPTDKAGSTVAGVVLGPQPFAFHVGDSRVYRWRGDELYQVTRDHSLVQMMVDDGLLTAEEAHFHPRRNIITRAIGTYGTPVVEFTPLELATDDLLLICSDGLSDELTQNELKDQLIAHAGGKVANLVTDLTDCALAAGGHDNITVIALQISSRSV